MPKSKRSTVVHLTKTKKKTKEQKGELIEEIQKAADDYASIWVFTMENPRNVHLQEIRSQWKPDRIFMGRNALMRVALGKEVESEHRPGLAALANMLEGDTGLLFTNEQPKVVVEWFEDFTRADFARKGNVATETVEVPAGPVMLRVVNDDAQPAPHSLEPHLRSLGLPTTLLKGVPTLASPHLICKEGETLQTNQAALLKQLGYQMAQFRVVLGSVWERETGAIRDVVQHREELLAA